MKNKTEQLLLKYKRKETIFMKTENSRTNEPHKFVLNLWQKLDLRSSRWMNRDKSASWNDKLDLEV